MNKYEIGTSSEGYQVIKETGNNSIVPVDDVVVELQRLSDIGCIVDDAPELNMSNYDEDQVSELNEAMIRIYKVIYG